MTSSQAASELITRQGDFLNYKIRVWVSVRYRTGFIHNSVAACSVALQFFAQPGMLPRFRNARAESLPLTMLLGQKVVEFFCNFRIALAGELFEPLPVKNGEPATLIANQVHLLKLFCYFADAGAAHAEHVRHKLLRQLELVCPDAIVEHEQPASQPSLYLMAGVANHGLRYLGDQRMRVTKERVLKLPASAELFPKLTDL